jgi:hypothetical protein
MLSTVTTWEIAMHEELNQVGFPELMTETELMHFLRIPDVSHGANPHHVVENLNRFHQLPCIPLTAVRRWVEDKLAKEGPHDSGFTSPTADGIIAHGPVLPAKARRKEVIL